MTLTEAHASPPPRTITVEEYYLARYAFAKVPVFHIDRQITYISISITTGPNMYAVRYGTGTELHYIDGGVTLYLVTPWKSGDTAVRHE